jgi:hypothetical protein
MRMFCLYTVLKSIYGGCKVARWSKSKCESEGDGVRECSCRGGRVKHPLPKFTHVVKTSSILSGTIEEEKKVLQERKEKEG